MYAFRTYSWSLQARVFYNSLKEKIDNNNWSIDRAIYFIHMSYHADIVRGRAAKKFGRKLRAGKLIESSQAAAKWKEMQESSYYPNEKRGFRY